MSSFFLKEPRKNEETAEILKINNDSFKSACYFLRKRTGDTKKIANLLVKLLHYGTPELLDKIDSLPPIKAGRPKKIKKAKKSLKLSNI